MCGTFKFKISSKSKKICINASFFKLQYQCDEMLENTKNKYINANAMQPQTKNCHRQSSSAIKHARKSTKRRTRLHGDSIRCTENTVMKAIKTTNKIIKLEMQMAYYLKPPNNNITTRTNAQTQTRKTVFISAHFRRGESSQRTQSARIK